jgi:uncharacterized membrane protein YphA (DoxX/SURF4 family)
VKILGHGPGDVLQPVMLRNVLRCAIGVLILATGVGKLLDVPGFVDVVETYRLGLSVAQTWAGAVLVICVEIGIGVWLLSGYMLRTAAVAAAALNTAWFFMLAGALLRGLQLENCGCFGVFLARPLRWYSPLEDLAIVAACLLLADLALTDQAGRPQAMQSAGASES